MGTDLSAVPTHDLRAELHRREQEQVASIQAAMNEWYGPCPSCGGEFVSSVTNIVREERSYDEETSSSVIVAAHFEVKLTCGVGHVSMRRETRRYNPPIRTAA